MSAGLTLVTGGAGFLGRHVVAALQAQGVPVRVFDVQPPPSELASGVAVEWRQGSVTDRQAVANACAGAEQVIHLAAIAHLWAANPADFDAVNHHGTRHVLAAARSHGCTRLVHVSSLTTRVSGRTGGAPRMQSEADIPPLSAMLGAYPRSKWQAEDAVRAAGAAGLPVRIAIPTLPLGPGDITMTPPTRMVLDYVSGATPAYLQSWLNICDVRDMAAGIVALADVDAPPHGVFLGGDTLSMQAFLALLQRVSGRPMPRLRVPGVAAQMVAQIDELISRRITGRPPTAPITGVRLARRPVIFDTSLARTLLGFAPRPLEETLHDLLAWFQSEGYWAREPAA